MSRAHGFWVAFNRPRRRGTGWIEAGAAVAIFGAWLVFSHFVFEPRPDGNTTVFFVWGMVPVFGWLAWMIWYRNHRPDPVEPAPPPIAPEMLPPGMVYPGDWRPTPRPGKSKT